MITQERVRELFTYHEGLLYWKTRGQKKAGCQIQDGATHVTIDSKTYKLHRLIYLYHYGELPQYLDHIDGNRNNNAIENLRPVSFSQNRVNSKLSKNNTSGYRGVRKQKDCIQFLAQLKVQGKLMNLGYYKTKEEAALAYNQAAIQHFGEFAKLNEVSI